THVPIILTQGRHADGSVGLVLRSPCQSPRKLSQDLAIGRRALTIQTYQGHFVAGGRLPRGALVSPVHQVFDANAQYRGDTRQVGGDLAGSAGLPLRHSAARYANRFRQLILGPAPVLSGSSDARPDVAWIGHSGRVGEFR